MDADGVCVIICLRIRSSPGEEEYVPLWPGKRFRVFNFANILKTFQSLRLLRESQCNYTASTHVPQHRLDYILLFRVLWLRVGCTSSVLVLAHCCSCGVLRNIDTFLEHVLVLGERRILFKEDVRKLLFDRGCMLQINPFGRNPRSNI